MTINVNLVKHPLLIVSPAPALPQDSKTVPVNVSMATTTQEQKKNVKVK